MRKQEMIGVSGFKNGEFHVVQGQSSGGSAQGPLEPVSPAQMPPQTPGQGPAQPPDRQMMSDLVDSGDLL